MMYAAQALRVRVLFSPQCVILLGAWSTCSIAVMLLQMLHAALDFFARNGLARNALLLAQTEVQPV